MLLPPDRLVSMNLWGFRPEIFDVLADGFARFVRNADLAREEYPLPSAVQWGVRRGLIRVRVLDAGEAWFGVTHAADAHSVREALARHIADGRYPRQL